MVDQEVTDILAEIKARVVSVHDASSATQSADNNFLPHKSETQYRSNNDFPSVVVLDRTWDRLPPVVSNRTGTTASLELWLKRKIKRLFHWFTWEQVNFNAATRQTLLEIIDSLASYEQHLEAQRDELNQQRAELLSEIRTTREQSEQHNLLLTSQQRELQQRCSELERAVETIRSQNSQGFEQQKRETENLLSQVVSEFRQSNERLLDEQRVCFKQLALQLSESQVLQDRARRQLDSRVTKLENQTVKNDS